MFGSIRNTDPILLIEMGLRWWFGELRQILPGWWEQLFGRGDRTALTAVCVKDPTGHKIVAWLTPGACATSGTTDGVLLIANELTYVRSIEVPLVSSMSLRKIIQFEALRYNPMVGSDSCFDYYVSERDWATRRMRVTLIFFKRTLLDEAVEMCRREGTTLRGVYISYPQVAIRLPRLLASKGMFARLSRRQLGLCRRIGGGLLAAACLTMVLALRLHLEQESMVEEIRRLQMTAHATEPARIALRDLQSQIRTLNEERRNSSEIAGLAELTDKLPDSAWLSHVRAEGDSIAIEGFSTKASSLIETLSRSQLFHDVRFAGPITRNVAVNAEQFSLSIHLSSSR